MGLLVFTLSSELQCSILLLVPLMLSGTCSQLLNTTHIHLQYETAICCPVWRPYFPALEVGLYVLSNQTIWNDVMHQLKLLVWLWIFMSEVIANVCLSLLLFCSSQVCDVWETLHLPSTPDWQDRLNFTNWWQWRKRRGRGGEEKVGGQETLWVRGQLSVCLYLPHFVLQDKRSNITDISEGTLSGTHWFLLNSIF